MKKGYFKNLKRLATFLLLAVMLTLGASQVAIANDGMSHVRFDATCGDDQSCEVDCWTEFDDLGREWDCCNHPHAGTLRRCVEIID